MERARRKSEPPGRFFVEPALAELAEAQHCVFDLGQIAALGMTPRAIQKRAAAKRLHRVHHGVYSLVPPDLLTGHGRWMAAVLACGDGAALSVHSAAALLDLRATARARIDVTVPKPGGHRRAGIQIHRSTTLRPGDVTTADGIPCTTVARTVFDLAEVVGRRSVERVIDRADELELLDVDELAEQIDHNAGRSKPAGVLTAALEDHRPGSTPTWNEFEERMLAVSRAVGLQDPEVQAWLDLGDGEPMIKPDFLWREQRLIVETDGFGTHGTRGAFERDRRRDQRAVAAGWRVIRVTWLQLKYEPARIGQTLLVLAAPASAAAAA